MLMSWDDILDSEQTEVDFVLKPYIPRGGIALMHGRKSLGKSPVSWTMGLAVAAGSPWCGLETTQTTVLYIEVDTPAISVVPRIKRLAEDFPGRGIPFHFMFFSGGINILAPRVHVEGELMAFQEETPPGLVIVNTLRKVFTVSGNDGEVPSQVYGAFQRLFPQAAFLFVHHDRKIQKETSQEMQREDLSGSLAWANDAQVTLHLVRSGKRPGSMRLDHTGSQVSEIHPPLMLQLAENGSHVSISGEETAAQAASILGSIPPGTPSRVVDGLIADALHCSERTARTLRLKYAGKSSK
jgi:hypothetical protein